MDSDLENPFTNSGDSLCSEMASLLRVENDHMLAEAYVKSLKLGGSDFTVRRDTISSISQKPKPWVIQHLAVSYVSLAAKMQKTEFSLPCLQGVISEIERWVVCVLPSRAECGIIFDALTIQRMEMLILGALKWGMRSITPFSFHSFIPLFKLENPASRQALKA